MIRNDARMVILEESDLNDLGRAEFHDWWLYHPTDNGVRPHPALKYFNYDLKEFVLMPDLVLFKHRRKVASFSEGEDVYAVLWDKLEIQDMMRQSYLADIYGFPTDEVGKKSYEKALDNLFPKVSQQLEGISIMGDHDDGHPNDGFVEEDFH